MTPQYLAKLENDLTKEDWQYIHFCLTEKINRINKPLPGEEKLKPSKSWQDQTKRILFFLQAKAFG
jgi:hypothetical protein